MTPTQMRQQAARNRTRAGALDSAAARLRAIADAIRNLLSDLSATVRARYGRARQRPTSSDVPTRPMPRSRHRRPILVSTAIDFEAKPARLRSQAALDAQAAADEAAAAAAALPADWRRPVPSGGVTTWSSCSASTTTATRFGSLVRAASLSIGARRSARAAGAMATSGRRSMASIRIDRFATTMRPGSIVELHVAEARAGGPGSSTTVPAPGVAGRSTGRPAASTPVRLPPIPAPSSRARCPGRRFRFGWAALVVPVVLGVILAVVIHPGWRSLPVFAPAMALANWIEERRRARQGVRRNTEALHQELAAFRANAGRDDRRQSTRLRYPCAPQPERADRLGRIDRLQVCGSGGRHHEDVMRLALGSACIPWSPELSTGYDAPAPEASALVDELGILHDVPIVVSLDPGSVVGISGAAHVRRAVAQQS